MSNASKKPMVRKLAAILKQAGVEDVVVSPGSRNAPFTIQFTGDPYFNCYSVVDERAAGFFALGIAQQKAKPVVVCCTSGSATVNYYPAVVEAFYQNIPLIVLSADRPQELVDQFDGQTIRQYKLFDNHILDSRQIDGDLQGVDMMLLEEIQASLSLCKSRSGPIHFNVSFHEPLYELVPQEEVILPDLPKPSLQEPRAEEIQNFLEVWNAGTRKMILVGMQKPSTELQQLLEQLALAPDTILLCETTSNLNHPSFVCHIDRLIFSLDDTALKELQPDVLLTIGQNIVSKKVKSFLRKFKADRQFHLDPYWQPNTYFSLTDSLNYSALSFLPKVLSNLKANPSNYQQKWLDLKEKRAHLHSEYVKGIGFSDFLAFHHLIPSIPDGCHIHFSNSSAIRYAQLFDYNPTHKIFCNRGTSGIDGCTGTAIGHALAAQPDTTLLITGDIGFFYDINSLWNNYIPNNFKVVLINNGGGNIFKIIPGPDQSEALESFFVTQHQRDAEKIAAIFGFDYVRVREEASLKKGIDQMFLSDKPFLLEVDTADVNNHEVLRAYFKFGI